MRKTILWTFTVSVLVGILVYSFFFIEKDLSSRIDFTAYFTAAKIIISGKGSYLYDIGVQGEYQRMFAPGKDFIAFRNPPLLALIFSPLGFFDLNTAWKIFVIIGLVVVLYASTVIWNLYPKLEKSVVLFLIISFFPGIISIVTGQISFALLTVWLFIYKFMMEKKDVESGIMTGLLFIKPQYLMLFPFMFLLTNRKKKFFAGFFWTFLVLSILSVFLVGVRGIIGYPHFLLQTESAGFNSDPYSQITFTSLLHNISYVFGLKNGWEEWANFIFYGISLVWFYDLIREGRKEKYFYLATFLTMLFVPHLWDYDLVLILPAFFYLLNLQISPPKHRKTMLIAVSSLIYLLWVVRFAFHPLLIPLLMLLIVFFWGRNGFLDTKKQT